MRSINKVLLSPVSMAAIVTRRASEWSTVVPKTRLDMSMSSILVDASVDDMTLILDVVHRVGDLLLGETFSAMESEDPSLEEYPYSAAHVMSNNRASHFSTSSATSSRGNGKHRKSDSSKASLGRSKYRGSIRHMESRKARNGNHAGLFDGADNGRSNGFEVQLNVALDAFRFTLSAERGTGSISSGTSFGDSGAKVPPSSIELASKNDHVLATSVYEPFRSLVTRYISHLKHRGALPLAAHVQQNLVKYQIMKLCVTWTLFLRRSFCWS